MILLVEACDYRSFPVGGTLSSALLLLRSFGRGFALVGISTDDTPVGEWVEKEVEGHRFPFFATGSWRCPAKRPLVPGRVRFYRELRSWRKEITALGCRHAYAQTAEALLGISDWGFDKVAFRFAGTENSLGISRYAWARRLAGIYERYLFSVVSKADLILASGSEQAIENLCERSRGRLSAGRLHRFPTAVDTSRFRPVDAASARAATGFPEDADVIAVSGRIHAFKGWAFLLESLRVLLQVRPRAHMVFIGGGDDRVGLEHRAQSLGVWKHVTVTGFQSPDQVAVYLNSADVLAVGSLAEGWSVAMLEGLACGKPIVSTDVSGARELIQEGTNGFVVAGRDPLLFADALDRAFELSEAAHASRDIAEQYSCERLPKRLASLWEPFALCLE